METKVLIIEDKIVSSSPLAKAIVDEGKRVADFEMSEGRENFIV